MKMYFLSFFRLLLKFQRFPFSKEAVEPLSLPNRMLDRFWLNSDSRSPKLFWLGFWGRDRFTPFLFYGELSLPSSELSRLPWLLFFLVVSICSAMGLSKVGFSFFFYILNVIGSWMMRLILWTFF